MKGVVDCSGVLRRSGVSANDMGGVLEACANNIDFSFEVCQANEEALIIKTLFEEN